MGLRNIRTVVVAIVSAPILLAGGVVWLSSTRGTPLTEHFQKQGGFRSADYVPTPGDVVPYSPEHALRQHTNFVVAVSGDTVTTVGGNQRGGISALTYQRSDTRGIVGCGVPVR